MGAQIHNALGHGTIMYTIFTPLHCKTAKDPPPVEESDETWQDIKRSGLERVTCRSEQVTVAQTTG